MKYPIAFEASSLILRKKTEGILISQDWWRSRTQIIEEPLNLFPLAMCLQREEWGMTEIKTLSVFLRDPSSEEG